MAPFRPRALRLAPECSLRREAPGGEGPAADGIGPRWCPRWCPPRLAYHHPGENDDIRYMMIYDDDVMIYDIQFDIVCYILCYTMNDSS